jgi:hypothetical protein
MSRETTRAELGVVMVPLPVAGAVDEIAVDMDVSPEGGAILSQF